MANDLRYVNSGDKILATQYNKIVDYVNGPGEYSTGEYTTTNKGVLYQNGDRYITGEGATPIPLLQGSVRSVYDETSSYTDYYHLQLGATESQTYESFTLDNRPIQSIYVCNVESDQFNFKVSSDTWDDINQGLLNTKIKTTPPEEISSFYDGLRGVFYTIDLISSDNHNTDDTNIATIYKFLVLTNHPYYNLSDSQTNTTPLDDNVFTLVKNDEQLSDYNFDITSLKCKHSFPIFSYTEILSTDYYQQNLIQQHLGGYRYYTPLPKFPWEVNINSGHIERAYVQIGTYIFDSEISSTEISGDNFLMVDVENLSCVLEASPRQDSTTVPFKMFNFQRGLQVEYYNFMPVVPCWERYDV